jgi:SAM-dependent methyltransferase
MVKALCGRHHHINISGARSLTIEQVCYWDAVGEMWQRTSPQPFWRAHSDAVNAVLLARWLPSPRVERLLKTDLFDEAFSDGLYPQLARRARRIVGIDIAASIIRAGRSRHPGLHVAMADVRRLPFASGSFDVIVSNSTLDHFRSRREIVASLCELHRVLRMGGQLLLTLDNLANPIIAMRNSLPFRLVNWLDLVPYYVGATYGPHGLRRVVQEVGFEVHQVEATMHCPRVLVVALVRLIERRIGLATQSRLLRGLMAFERLACWPTRFLTGHFIAVRAIKP